MNGERRTEAFIVIINERCNPALVNLQFTWAALFMSVDKKHAASVTSSLQWVLNMVLNLENRGNGYLKQILCFKNTSIPNSKDMKQMAP